MTRFGPNPLCPSKYLPRLQLAENVKRMVHESTWKIIDAVSSVNAIVFVNVIVFVMLEVKRESV
jgi:hypothetical protein